MASVGEASAAVGAFWSWWQDALLAGGMSPADLQADPTSRAVRKFSLDVEAGLPTAADAQLATYLGVAAADLAALGDAMEQPSPDAAAIISRSRDLGAAMNSYTLLIGGLADNLRSLQPSLAAHLAS